MGNLACLQFGTPVDLIILAMAMKVSRFLVSMGSLSGPMNENSVSWRAK